MTIKIVNFISLFFVNNLVPFSFICFPSKLNIELLLSAVNARLNLDICIYILMWVQLDEMD